MGDRFEVLFNLGKPAVPSSGVDVSWTLPACGYVLQTTDNLSGSWSTVNTPPVERPEQRSAVGLEQTGASTFFRLQKP